MLYDVVSEIKQLITKKKKKKKKKDFQTSTPETLGQMNSQFHMETPSGDQMGLFITVLLVT